MKHGIDISEHQGYNVDFAKVKAAGVDLVILRAGYGRYIKQKDPTFEGNYKRAKAAGLNVGVYWYSYATTPADAKTEAQTCLEAIKGKKFEYPIYFDLEEAKQFSTGKNNCSAMVEAFCTVLEKAGYFAGLYMSRSPLTQYITADVQKKYALWIAEYNSKCNYSGAFGIWQNSSTWRVAGIGGNVDHDCSYVDYPKLIINGGFNGYPKPKVEEKPKTETKTENKTQNTAAKPAEEKTKTESKPETSTAYERGDVNGDGKINITDVVQLAAHVKGKKLLKK